MSLGDWDPITVSHQFERITGRFRCPACKKLLQGWHRTRTTTGRERVLTGQSLVCRKCGLKWERDVALVNERVSQNGLGQWRITWGGPSRLELLRWPDAVPE